MNTIPTIIRTFGEIKAAANRVIAVCVLLRRKGGFIMESTRICVFRIVFVWLVVTKIQLLEVMIFPLECSASASLLAV